MRQESNFFEEVDEAKPGSGGDAEVSSVLSAYKSEGDPAEYEDAYMGLQAFIEKSLDAYKVCYLVDSHENCFPVLYCFTV